MLHTKQQQRLRLKAHNVVSRKPNSQVTALNHKALIKRVMEMGNGKMIIMKKCIAMPLQWVMQW